MNAMAAMALQCLSLVELAKLDATGKLPAKLAALLAALQTSWQDVSRDLTCYVDPFLACSVCNHKCLLNRGETALLCQWLVQVAGLPSYMAHGNVCCAVWCNASTYCCTSFRTLFCHCSLVFCKFDLYV